MIKITEQPSKYRHLEKMTIHDLLMNINKEDKIVPNAVEKAIPSIEPLVAIIVEKMQEGGRLFYIGAGTSGRLGILDASECPPTYGVPHGWVIGLIAGGQQAIQYAVEHAEDSANLAWEDLLAHHINKQDVVIGITASGTTPYVVHGLKNCQANQVTTSCITCNIDAPVKAYSDFPIEVIVGTEFVTGSSRMKAGTAQKLILNMISTTVMIRLGRVLDNKMVDMQLSNSKLIDRGTKMVVAALEIEYEAARKLLLEYGSVRAVLNAIH